MAEYEHTQEDNKMNILDMIGNTPLMNIDNVYFKLEMFNPSGSIKDRIALEMLRSLKPGTQVVEATSGNTGVSFAMVAAALKLKCKLYCPSGTSPLKRKMMLAYGAEVSDCQHTHGEMFFLNNLQDCLDAIKRSAELAPIYLNQFSNPLNVKAQEKMAFEAWCDLCKGNHFLSWSNAPDAIVAGVGTGGTLMGLHNTFPEADVYMVVPVDRIEGICDNVDTPLIPMTLKPNLICVTYLNATETAAYLAQRHGIHCGVSSGANYFAALTIARKYKRVLTVLPDSGDRYL